MSFYITDEDDYIIKSRSHKYIKRVGTPGNYRYYYRLPDGQIVEGDAGQQEDGKRDHLKRLVAGKEAGVHSLSDQQIGERVGVETHKVRWARSNLHQSARTTGRPHPYERHHLDEAHADVHHPSYERHIQAAVDHEASEARSPRSSRPRRPRAARTATASSAPTSPTSEASAPAQAASSPTSASAPAAASAAPAPAAREKTPSERIAKLRAKLAEKHGIRLGEPERPTPAPAPAPTPAPTLAPTAQAAPTPDPEREAERARALSARAAHPESNPGTPHAAELSRSDPDFGASEQEVQRSVRAQQNGHNPYLHRAVEIFHRIRGDLKEERKKSIDHFFQAYDSVQARGETPTRENVLAAYKALPGNERKRTLPADEIEKGTFHTLDEIFDNPPLNPEHERMKRGYAMKQFQRVKPFLKDSWLATHPSAPPPMPTFGDLKSWTEHGGPKPSWAGQTRMAVPEEIFNATHKSPDGKPKYPPAWMPVHLMPLWTYAAKNMEREGGASIWEARGSGGAPAYAAHRTPMRDESSPTGFKVDMGSQARSGQEFRDHGPEGMIVSALRKYVQMRGGPEQLVDIPGSKLAALGLTHRDIFKGELSDAELKRLSASKVIDPVGLMACLKREMKGVQKSFELVADLDAAYVPGSTLRKAAPELPVDLVKSRRIERIKGILSARGRA